MGLFFKGISFGRLSISPRDKTWDGAADLRGPSVDRISEQTYAGRRSTHARAYGIYTWDATAKNVIYRGRLF